MPRCKQKIQAAPDQVFSYLSNLQNVVDLYKDKVPIKTVKDLGSACYGKKYQYEVENTNSTRLKKHAFTIEIIEYEPYEVIAWAVEFDRRTFESKHTTYIPTVLNLTCRLKPKDEYTLALLDYDFEFETSLMLKLVFQAVVRSFQHRLCKVLVDVKKDIEQPA